jgi:hypothetical protein
MWIIHHGRRLFVQIVKKPDPVRSGTEASQRPGPLVGGRSILGIQRWWFWKLASRMAVTERDGVGEECRRLAGRAVGLMDTIEWEMG